MLTEHNFLCACVHMCVHTCAVCVCACVHMCVHVSDPDAVVLVMCVLIVAAQAVAGAGQCAWSPCRELHRGARRGLVSAQSWGPVSASPSHLAPPPWCPGPQLPLGCHLSLYGTSAHTGVIYTVSGRPHGGLLVRSPRSLWASGSHLQAPSHRPSGTSPRAWRAGSSMP